MYRDNITLPQPHMLKQAVVLRILFYFIFKEQSIEDKSKQWKVSFKIWKHLHFYCIFMGKSLQNLTWIIWYSTSNPTTNGEPSPLQINFPPTKILNTVLFNKSFIIWVKTKVFWDTKKMVYYWNYKTLHNLLNSCYDSVQWARKNSVSDNSEKDLLRTLHWIP